MYLFPLSLCRRLLSCEAFLVRCINQVIYVNLIKVLVRVYKYILIRICRGSLHLSGYICISLTMGIRIYGCNCLVDHWRMLIHINKHLHDCVNEIS